MIGLLVLLTSAFGQSHANPSTLARCAGAGWSIEVGASPAAPGEQMLELTTDDGRNHVAAFDAAAPARGVSKRLAEGLRFTNKIQADDQGVFKLNGTTGAWTYRGVAHVLDCQIN